jgi:thiol:disulfide interchange protein DsbA
MSSAFGRRAFLAAAAAAMPALALAQAKPKAPEAGKDYLDLRPPQPAESGNKIEVLEFFWYGCPHCASFEPDLTAWRMRMPADVSYRRSPVAFSDAQTPHSRIYYALEALNKTDALHTRVFREIVGNRKPLLKPEDIADFMAGNGIERKQWLDTFNSFTVATRATRAAQVWRAYKIDGTPSVAIDGKFVTAPSQAGGRAECLRVMDFLIDRARASRAKA